MHITKVVAGGLPVPCLIEDKSYKFLFDIVNRVVQRKVNGIVSSVEADKVKLARNIAKLPRPAKEELITHHTSRFGKM